MHPFFPVDRNGYLSNYIDIFLHLYGPKTLNCLCLALTDDNSQSHGAFDGATQVLACYSNTILMLCVFHAIVMKYHDTVYGKLPKQQGNKRKVRVVKQLQQK